jgi:transcriptional regulator with XRE-family HTH domain
MPPEKKASKTAGRPLGATGETVRANIRHVRDEQRNLPVTELSARMSAVGRPIPPLGLHRIESGDRRVDVDDLLALALALEVSPVTLLMPRKDSGDDSVSVTGLDESTDARRLWRWLTAEHPLIGDAADAVIGFLYRSTPGWHLGEQFDVEESGLEPYATTRYVRRNRGDETV